MKIGAKRGNYPHMTHDQFYACNTGMVDSNTTLAAYEVLVYNKQLMSCAKSFNVAHSCLQRKVAAVVARYHEVRKAFLGAHRIEG